MFSTQCRRLKIFQTMSSVITNNLSLKCQRCTPFGCKDIGIYRKFDFVAKPLFLCFFSKFWWILIFLKNFPILRSYNGITKYVRKTNIINLRTQLSQSGKLLIVIYTSLILVLQIFMLSISQKCKILLCNCIISSCSCSWKGLCAKFEVTFQFPCKRGLMYISILKPGGRELDVFITEL